MTMPMEYVMFKYVSLFIIIVTLSISSCTRSHAEHVEQAENQTAVNSSVPDNEVDEIVVKLDGSKKTAVSTQLSKINEEIFCDGHKIIANLERSINFDGDNEFTTNELALLVNGETINSKNFKSSLQNFRHFGFDFTCLEDTMYLDVIGYNDNEGQSGSSIIKITIDKNLNEKIIVNTKQ